jgi:hypothetical protein
MHAKSKRTCAMMQAEHNIVIAQIEVNGLIVKENIIASFMHKGWAVELAKATKARIAAKRRVVEARKAEEEVRAGNKRAK